MAIHMPLGFLLGSDSCTFGRSKLQITCLLISLPVPDLPQDPLGQRLPPPSPRPTIYIISGEPPHRRAGESESPNPIFKHNHMKRKSQPHIGQRVENIRTRALLEQRMVNRIRVIGNLYYPADITGGGRAWS